ncbi:membrane protein insertion efficiency factor YidD [bacterium]|nr:membrane protein insertion efficiency factor YidD [bacterium]
MFKAIEGALRVSALFLIKFYQKYLSPATLPTCRYTPTCSEYARQAFIKYSFFKAFGLSAKRFFSCHPFSKGGYDPLK